MAFIFDASKNETPQTLARKRAIIAQIMGQASQQRPARSAAEGLGNAFSSIANGVAANVMNRRADAAEQAGMQGANDLKGKLSDWLKNGAPPVGGGSLPTPGVSGEMAATAPDPVNISGGKQEFVNALLPAAMEESQRTGIDPRIIVAQAAQETGWGKSAPGNNYFGIKSHGQSGGNSLMTTEYVNGQPVQQRDSFRAYGSPADSVRGYGDFMLQNPRYRAMREAQGLDAQLAALGASGYATDPNYSRSVGAIAKGIRLPQDGGAAGAIEGIAPTQPPQVTQNQFNERFTGSQSELPPLPAGREVGPAPGMNMPTQPQRDAPQQAAPQQLMAPRELPLDLLFQIISNPFSDDGVKALANNMLEQQMRRSDPSHQLDMDYRRAQIDALNRKAENGSDETFFGNPVAIQNQDGSISYGQIGNKGSFRPIQLGEGQTFAPPTKTVNTGTENILMDQAGNVISRTPIENRQAASEKARGAAEGQTMADRELSAAGEIQTAQNALDLIDSIKNDPYRQRGTGASSVFNAIPGTGGYDFSQKVEQAKSGAFLTAIQQMKGLGALSNAEGQAATAAITRMNTAMSEEGFMSALSDYEKIVRQAYDRAASRIGGSALSKGQRQPISIGGYTIEEVE